MGQTNISEDGDVEELIQVTEEKSKEIIQNLIDEGILDWNTIAEEMLQTLQPPQTATHVPQLSGIRNVYEKGDRWAPAREWMYAEYGPCQNCGQITSITHDHIVEKDVLGEKADRLENLRFLCRRCNQSRHWEKGNILEMGTAASVMYLLLTKEPTTLKELEELGREAGLTQSNQRFEESWAFAVYLYREDLYELDEIHPEIDEEEFDDLEDYYRETNDFYKEMRDRIEDEYPEKIKLKEGVGKIIRKRKTKLEDRFTAAEKIGLDEDSKAMEVINRDKKLSSDDKEEFLSDLGIFSESEIKVIAREGKVNLFQILDEEERDELISEIENGVEDIREENLN